MPETHVTGVGVMRLKNRHLYIESEQEPRKHISPFLVLYRLFPGYIGFLKKDSHQPATPSS